MPSIPHQRIFMFLVKILLAYIELQQRGEIFSAPVPLRLRSGKFRESDIIFILDKNDARIRRQYLGGADLVMEIVSPGNPTREYEIKRAEYAEAGITEYWITDPQQEVVTVLALTGQNYATHELFRRGDKATSVRLSGFSVDVEEMLAAGEGL